jgi:hypothetical protein
MRDFTEEEKILLYNEGKSALGFPFIFKSTGNLDNYCPICGISAFDHLHEAGKSPKEFVMNESMEERFEKEFLCTCPDKTPHLEPNITIEEIKSFVRKEINIQKKQILDILVDEINIVHLKSLKEKI